MRKNDIHVIHDIQKRSRFWKNLARQFETNGQRQNEVIIETYLNHYKKRDAYLIGGVDLEV